MRRSDRSHLLRSFLSFVGRHLERPRRRLSLSLALSVAQSLMLLGIPFLFREAFDRGVAAGNYLLFAALLLGAVALYGAYAGVAIAAKSYSLKITTRLTMRLRERLVYQVCRMPRDRYVNSDHGALHARLVQDTARVEDAGVALLNQLLPAGFVIIALGSALVLMQWILFLAALVLLPLVVIVNRAVVRRLSPEVRAYHRSFEEFSGAMGALIRVVEFVQAHAFEEHEQSRHRQTMERMRRSRHASGVGQAAISLIHQTTVGMATVLLLAGAAFLVSQEVMTLGGLLGFFAAVGLVRNQANQIGWSLPRLVEGVASAETLRGFLQSDRPVHYSGSRHIDFRGHVTLEEVTFGYGETPLFHDVRMVLEPQRLAVLLGPNGAGKSTIAYLILGFHAPWHGTLSADGLPYSDVDLNALRSRISYVPQHPVLLPGTVRENLTYGATDVSESDLERALRLGTAEDILQDLPAGLETEIGENGVKLSGGQRQRLVLSRALLRNPALLILDEPSTHLDRAAVTALIHNIRCLDPQPAVLLITHEEELAAQADKLYRLDPQAGTVLTERTAAQVPEG